MSDDVFSRRARRPSEQLAIVEHVLNTEHLQETDYLEWKTSYNLSTNPGAASTAKHLIAFANRDISHALRFAEGHAYLLLGLEPGNLVGVPEWDSAQLEQWLVRFVGPELAYSDHYVGINGKRVLLFVVDPPRQGDSIYCLQRSSENVDDKNAMRDGTIYVRHGSESLPARAADIALLTARAQRAVAGPELRDLRIETHPPAVAAISSVDLSAESCEAYVQQERTGLMSGLPPRPRDRIAAVIDQATVMDPRGRHVFAEQVDAYGKEIRNTWRAIVTLDHVGNESSELVAVIANRGPHNFEDAVLELTLPFSINHVFTDRADAAARLETARRPQEFGIIRPRFLDHSEIIAPGRPPSPQLQSLSREETLVRYPPSHVRPHTTDWQPRLLLALSPAIAGTTVTARWRITARNTSGQFQGDFTIAILPADKAT
jgi:hypothetical protein